MNSSLVHVEVDTPATRVAEVLRDEGGVVVNDFLGRHRVDQLLDEFAGSLDDRQPGYRSAELEDFYGRRTKRLTGLARRSPTFVSSVLLHPTLLALCDQFLAPHCGRYWMNLGELISVGPGSAAQQLHRDDLNWPYVPALDQVTTQVEALIALGDYTAEMGATLVVPGSHRRRFDDPPETTGAIPAEMAPGSALLYLNSTWHGAGQNRTHDRWRTALHISFVVGWLTPEEASPVGLTKDEVLRFPERARSLLGWSSLEVSADGDAGGSPLWQLDPDDLVRLNGAFGQGPSEQG